MADAIDYVTAAILQHIKTVEDSKFLESRNASSFSPVFRQVFSADVQENMVETSLRRLVASGVCVAISDDFTKDYFIISENDADQFFDGLVEKGVEPFVKAHRLGKGWLSEALKNIARLGDDADHLKSVFVPASDRIVTLGDNSPAVQKIESEVSAFIESVRQNNEVVVALDQQAPRIVKELTAGRDIIASGNFRILAIFEVLIKPLRYIVEKFSGSALAETAKKLIDLIFEAVS